MIYKYELAITDSQELLLPKGAVILTVQNQKETLCLWALVDTNQKIQDCRTFRIYSTGDEHVPASTLRYVGTAQFMSGDLVWHVFEEI